MRSCAEGPAQTPVVVGVMTRTGQLVDVETVEPLEVDVELEDDYSKTTLASLQDCGAASPMVEDSGPLAEYHSEPTEVVVTTVARESASSSSSSSSSDEKPTHWLVRCKLDGYDQPMLVDTGCPRTLLSEAVYRRMHEGTLEGLKTSARTLTGVSGTGLTVLGSRSMTLEVGGRVCRAEVEVVKMTVEAILGLDTLTGLGCRLDCGERRLCAELEAQAEPSQLPYPAVQLVVAEDYVLRPGEERVVALRLQGLAAESWPAEGVVEPVGYGSTMAARALVRVEDGSVVSSMANFGRSYQEVPEGTVVAYLGFVEEVVAFKEPSGNRPTLRSSAEDVRSTAEEVPTWSKRDLQTQQEAETLRSSAESVRSAAKNIVDRNRCPWRHKIYTVEEGQETVLPSHLEEMMTNVAEKLSVSQRSQLRQLLKQYEDIFMCPGGTLGRTSLVRHSINTGDTPPIKQPLRRAPFKQQELIEAEVDKMLEAGVVEPSDSPWSSPVVLVKKKDGTQRFCVDYRRLNKATRGDAYPLPRIDDSFDTLAGSRYFSTLDLASGYWQVEVEEKDKQKTAFSTRSGLYQFRVMPFGLSTAPATFERLMEIAMRGLQWHKCLVYLDDVITIGKTFKEALENLRDVFDRLRRAGLKVKPQKCELFREKVEFLGHEVSEEGLKCSSKKVEAVKQYEPPRNLQELRSFLGFVGYYRRFIKNFATLAAPLTQLTQKNIPFIWGPKQQEAFDSLREPLIREPLVSYPDPEKTYILDTDASNFGIGGVLSQEHDDGREHVIAYASYTLRPTQKNYCTTKKELLAVVVMIHHFRHYLWGVKFRLRTDHASLKWLLNFKDAEGMIARWSARIASYNFAIEIREGTRHGNADGMSRCKQCIRPECPADGTSSRNLKSREDNIFEDEDILPVMTAEDWDMTCSTITEEVESNLYAPVLAGRSVQPTHFLQDVTVEDIVQEQEQDPDINPVLQWKTTQEARPDWRQLRARSQLTKTLWQQWDQLKITDGMLTREKRHSRQKQKRVQIVLPLTLRKKLFQQLHGAPVTAHLGITRTIERAQTKFYWPGMNKDVARWVQECTPCQTAKPRPGPKKQPLGQLPSGVPFERIAIDILEPGVVTSRNHRYIMVVADYFTKWVEAYALENHTAYTVADTLVTQFITRYGVPAQIHTDQGREFESALFRELAQLLHIEKTRTTPYSPQSDGLVERANRTILSLLRTFVNEQQDDWDDWLPYIMAAYRSSVQETTGCTPNLMLFGRENATPVELMFPCQVEEVPVCVSEYVEWVRSALQTAHTFAREHGKTALRRQKRNYDKKAVHRTFPIGTWVWNFYPPLGQKKMARGWTGPYLVVDDRYEHAIGIQRSPAAAVKYVHIDKLKKLYGEPPMEKWTGQQSGKGGEPSPPPAAEEVEEHQTRHQTSSEDEEEEPIPSTSTSMRPKSRRRIRKPIRFTQDIGVVTLQPSRFAEGPFRRAEGLPGTAEGPSHAAEGPPCAAEGPSWSAEGRLDVAEGPSCVAEGPPWTAEKTLQYAEKTSCFAEAGDSTPPLAEKSSTYDVAEDAEEDVYRGVSSTLDPRTPPWLPPTWTRPSDTPLLWACPLTRNREDPSQPACHQGVRQRLPSLPVMLTSSLGRCDPEIALVRTPPAEADAVERKVFRETFEKVAAAESLDFCEKTELCEDICTESVHFVKEDRIQFGLVYSRDTVRSMADFPGPGRRLNADTPMDTSETSDRGRQTSAGGLLEAIRTDADTTASVLAAVAVSDEVEGETVQCRECGMQLDRRNLQRHLTERHADYKARFACPAPRCQYYTARKADLARHLQTGRHGMTKRAAELKAEGVEPEIVPRHVYEAEQEINLRTRRRRVQRQEQERRGSRQVSPVPTTRSEEPHSYYATRPRTRTPTAERRLATPDGAEQQEPLVEPAVPVLPPTMQQQNSSSSNTDGVPPEYYESTVIMEVGWGSDFLMARAPGSRQRRRARNWLEARLQDRRARRQEGPVEYTDIDKDRFVSNCYDMGMSYEEALRQLDEVVIARRRPFSPEEDWTSELMTAISPPQTQQRETRSSAAATVVRAEEAVTSGNLSLPPPLRAPSPVVATVAETAVSAETRAQRETVLDTLRRYPPPLPRAVPECDTTSHDLPTSEPSAGAMTVPVPSSAEGQQQSSDVPTYDTEDASTVQSENTASEAAGERPRPSRSSVAESIDTAVTTEELVPYTRAISALLNVDKGDLSYALTEPEARFVMEERYTVLGLYDDQMQKLKRERRKLVAAARQASTIWRFTVYRDQFVSTHLEQQRHEHLQAVHGQQMQKLEEDFKSTAARMDLSLQAQVKAEKQLSKVREEKEQLAAELKKTRAELEARPYGPPHSLGRSVGSSAVTSAPPLQSVSTVVASPVVYRLPTTPQDMDRYMVRRYLDTSQEARPASPQVDSDHPTVVHMPRPAPRAESPVLAVSTTSSSIQPQTVCVVTEQPSESTQSEETQQTEPKTVQQ